MDFLDPAPNCIGFETLNRKQHQAHHQSAFVSPPISIWSVASSVGVVTAPCRKSLGLTPMEKEKPPTPNESLSSNLVYWTACVAL